MIKVFQKVSPQVFTKRFFNKANVFRIFLCSKGYFQELGEAADDVICKPLTLQDGDNIVFIRHERRF
ncbi:hypothetical protein DSECCO2_620220 [anaerobic digester metagenome]